MHVVVHDTNPNGKPEKLAALNSTSRADRDHSICLSVPANRFAAPAMRRGGSRRKTRTNPSSQNEKKRGSVWILNPLDKDFVPSEAKVNPFEIEQTQVYRPRHFTERLIAQAGYFTIHCFHQNTSSFTPIEKDLRLGKRLMEIQIEPDAFSDLRDNLERHGVSDLTMFPDLEGVCRYITWNNSLLRDEIDPPNILLNQGK